MPDKKQAAFQELVDRILNGEGRASTAQRAQAFDNTPISPSVDALIGKVVARPAEITAADVAAARTAVGTEDELFELVVCAAVGQSARLYEAGLSALAEATGDEGPAHAS
ncbi:hypothetical protein FB561_2323 [Kribbella amoyensis]|uniref:Carboxymuconolactone decarboxylase family protein n=1 Tax=Kribbella amoyensis TaxID=996641 RepID=A0A561BQQ3_9ACTN|nr:hypothetical protein [Kribbella amoyensis]TWD81217.1 hypothetical protein FB561_2323 [Kribbella amoyensis]